MRVAKVHQIEWHRNGVGGAGFYAILFDDPENGRMVAVLHDEPHYCSVLNVAALSDPEKGILFGLNSWRGDNYEAELRAAVKTAAGTGRLGAFSVPSCVRGREPASAASVPKAPPDPSSEIP